MKNLFDLDSVPPLPTSGSARGKSFNPNVISRTEKSEKPKTQKRLEESGVSRSESAGRNMATKFGGMQGCITPTTVNTSENSSDKEKSEETQLTVLRPSSKILKTAVLDSVNFADRSMKELSLRMKGLFSDLPSTETRLYDIERVQTAAGTARVIAELIKAKTEAMKLLTHQEQS